MLLRTSYCHHLLVIFSGIVSEEKGHVLQKLSMTWVGPDEKC